MAMFDPEIQKYMDRQRLQSWLQNVSQGLIQAGAGGMGLGSGLAYGVGSGANAPQTNPMQALQMQGAADARKRQQTQQEAFNHLWPESPGPQYAGQPSPHPAAPGPQYASAGGPPPGMAPVAPTGAPTGTSGSAGAPPFPRNLALALGPEKALELYARQSMQGPPKRETYQGPFGLQRDQGTGEPLPGQPSIDELKQWELEQRGASRTPDRQLVEVYDPTSPTMTRLVPRAEAAQQPGKPPSGLQVDFDPETGRPTSISTGRRGGSDQSLQKKTLGDIEAKVVQAREGIARLGQIQSGFQRDYQTFGTRWGAMYDAFMEKSGFELTPENQQELAAFTDWRRNAVENINLHIKDITGAQMSAAEVPRLKDQMPDPGTGLLDGDSPTEFQANLDSTMRSLRRAAARYTYALRNRKDPFSISLDSIDGIMEKRLSEMEQEVRAEQPGIDDESLREVLRTNMIEEFGLNL